MYRLLNMSTQHCADVLFKANHNKGGPHIVSAIQAALARFLPNNCCLYLLYFAVCTVVVVFSKYTAVLCVPSV